MPSPTTNRFSQCSMTMEKNIKKLDKLKYKKLQQMKWLHDSLEDFFKEKEPTPPTHEQEALLVGTYEEDEATNVGYDIPIVKQVLVDKFIKSGSYSDEDDEDYEVPTIGGSKRRFQNDCELYLNFDYTDSDSDEIIFEDGVEENNSIITVPFWFGNEDKDQLRIINAKYYRNLHLEEEKKRLIRQPEPFVGRVTRSQVDNGDIFTTLDVVEIYRRAIRNPSDILPFERKLDLLTCWSYEDGLPISFASLRENTLHLWKDKLIKGVKSSTLVCLPEYGNKEYSFGVSQNPLEVITYAPSSLKTTERRGWYEQYVPPHEHKHC